MSDEKIKVVNSISYQPQSEFILVRVDNTRVSRHADSMIIIPETTTQTKKTMVSVVVAVGPGRRDPNSQDKRIPIDCEPGQKILTASFIGYPILIPEGKTLIEHQIIKYNDILAFVDEDAELVDKKLVDGKIEQDVEPLIVTPN